MPLDWVKIYSTAELYKAEIIQAILEDNHIKTFRINKRDSIHVHLNNAEIEIFVDREHVIRAKHLISKSEL